MTDGYEVDPVKRLHRRLRVMYISGIGGEVLGLDLRLALDDLDEIEQAHNG